MNLIGIGDFSHGDINIWNYRFKLLKKYMKNTNKKIVIFNEMSIWQGKNIMNNTIWNIDKKKFETFNGIKIEKEIADTRYHKYWQYCSHGILSKIFLEIIRYIRKHKNRITIIGVDNDKVDANSGMYKIIIKNLDFNNINFFWAHNDHVGNLKYSCGHYLKEKLKDKYYIILSNAKQGELRFNGFCLGKDCNTRIWTKYFYAKFKNKNNKILEFSNSYWIGHDNSYQGGYYVKNIKYDYLLIFNKVSKLI
jgi:hypothetical protein